MEREGIIVGGVTVAGNYSAFVKTSSTSSCASIFRVSRRVLRGRSRRARRSSSECNPRRSSRMPTQRFRGGERETHFRKQMLYFLCGPVAAVGERGDDNRRSAGAVGFVRDALEHRRVGRGALSDRALDIFARHIFLPRLFDNGAQLCGIHITPAFLDSTVIRRESLLHTRLRAASFAPFCLFICAHLLCPDMRLFYANNRRTQKGAIMEGMSTLRLPLVGFLFCAAALLPLAAIAQDEGYVPYDGTDFSWMNDVQPEQLAEDQSLWSDPLWDIAGEEAPPARTGMGLCGVRERRAIRRRAAAGTFSVRTKRSSSRSLTRRGVIMRTGPT